MVTTVDERADPQLAEVVRRLVKVFQPERIYLFGSQARDDANEDSDYDLLVVVPHTSGTDRHRLNLAYESLWGIDAAADVIVQTHEQFENRAHLRSSLPGTVLREGKLLYAAG